LDLSRLHLTAVPDFIGNLSALTHLNLSGNQLTALPQAIGNLTSLINLDLYANRLTALPESMGNLTALTYLDLGVNQLIALPESMGNLTALTYLYLRRNQLTKVPESIGNLTNLTHLFVRGNQLTGLPDSMGNLTALIQLDLGDNQLTALPGAIGNLATLRTMDLGNNPLASPPPEVCAGGTQAVLAFLRGLREGTAEEWTSKMLVVGEAAVGKTSVTKGLCGLPYDPAEPQTHGVHVDPLVLDHPARADRQMQLNVWDFGGQLEYRATQRFYLTDRSLFVLVFSSRRGSRSTGGRVEEWLQAITAVAPSSPLVVVATHSSEFPADLDEADLRRRHPRIAAIARVDCRDGMGIDELRETIRHLAAELPLMGLRWPSSWVAAADRLTGHPARFVTVARADELMAEPGLDGPGIKQVVRAVLHDRGDILHFPHDPELADRVILQPSWVDKMITRVLDSRRLADAGGVLSRTHRAELWRDLDDPGLEEMLTALMERFDLAYRLESPDHADVALVVDRLPTGTPITWPEAWQRILADPDMREVRLTYKLSSRQAGIPSWFIAREHRFTTGTAWSHGVLLTHRGQADPAWALLEDDGQSQPTLRLRVRGTHPYGFYSLLDEGFAGIIAHRYPGLQLRRLIPCPCSTPPAPPCVHEFDYTSVRRYLDRGVELRCDQSLDTVDPRTLLLGLRPFHMETQFAHLDRGLHQLQTSTARIEASQLRILDCIRDLLRDRGEQGTHCPSIFTITPTKRSIFGTRRYELRLYCEQSDAPHPLTDGAGVYELTDVPGWLRTYAPYLKALLTALRHALPVLAPALAGIGQLALPETIKGDLDLSCKLLEGLDELTPEGGISGHAASSFLGGRGEHIASADFRELRQALRAIDPEFGGLRERQLPENRGIAYLCPHHRQALRYPQTTPELTR
jgi:internalin A